MSAKNQAKNRWQQAVLHDTPWRKLAPCLLLVLGMSIGLGIYYRGWLLPLGVFLVATIIVVFLIRKKPEILESWWQKVILALLMGVCLFLLKLPFDRWVGPSREPPKKIVLIGPRDDAHWTSFVGGFHLALGQQCGRGRAVFDVVEPGLISGEVLVEDIRSNTTHPYRLTTCAYSDMSDFNKTIQEIVDDRDVVMVIGFVSSTPAKEALLLVEKAEKEASDWPAIILPMVTATDLVRDFNESTQCPILRIVPSNLGQARSIADFIEEHWSGNGLADEPDVAENGGRKVPKSRIGMRKPRVAIFRDLTNSVYSNDLTMTLIACLEFEKGIPVVADGSVGYSGPAAYVTDSFAIYEPDYVVFLGMIESAVPLCRQLFAVRDRVNGGLSVVAESRTKVADGSEAESRAENGHIPVPWNPLVILSDGSVNPKTAKRLSLGTASPVVGFFPHGALNQDSGKCRDYCMKEAPSFACFGHDATHVACEVLAMAERPSRDGIYEALRAFKVARQRKRSAQADHSGGSADVRGPDTRGRTPVRLDDLTLVGAYYFDEYGDLDAECMAYHAWVLEQDRWLLLNDRDASQDGNNSLLGVQDFGRQAGSPGDSSTP